MFGIFQEEMPNISCLKLLTCKDFSLLSALFVFWNDGQTKQVIRGRHLGL